MGCQWLISRVSLQGLFMKGGGTGGFRDGLPMVSRVSL